MFSLFILLGYDFVDDYPSDSHVVLFAQDSIQFEFIKGPTEATIGAGDWVTSMMVINNFRKMQYSVYKEKSRSFDGKKVRKNPIK